MPWVQWNIVDIPSGVKSADATMGPPSSRGGARPAIMAFKKVFCC